MPVYPVDMNKCVITSHYGERIHPVTGEWSFHNGTDFAPIDGIAVQVCAVQDGIIIDEYTDNVGTKIIVLEHFADGYYSKYLHLDYYIKDVGARVKAGEVIAMMGNTGVSTGVHLHLNVSLVPYGWDPSNTIDPLIYLKGAPSPDPDEPIMPSPIKKKRNNFVPVGRRYYKRRT